MYGRKLNRVNRIVAFTFSLGALGIFTITPSLAMEKQETQSTQTSFNNALTLYVQQQYTLAIQKLENTSDFNAMGFLAMCYLKSGGEKDEQKIQALMNMSSKNGSAWGKYAWGLWWEIKERTNSAKPFYLLASNAGIKAATVGYASIIWNNLRKQDKPSIKATQDLLKYLEGKNLNAEGYALIGQIYEDTPSLLENKEKARQAYEQAQERLCQEEKNAEIYRGIMGGATTFHAIKEQLTEKLNPQQLLKLQPSFSQKQKEGASKKPVEYPYWFTGLEGTSGVTDALYKAFPNIYKLKRNGQGGGNRRIDLKVEPSQTTVTDKTDAGTERIKEFVEKGFTFCPHEANKEEDKKIPTDRMMPASKIYGQVVAYSHLPDAPLTKEQLDILLDCFEGNPSFILLMIEAQMDFDIQTKISGHWKNGCPKNIFAIVAPSFSQDNSKQAADAIKRIFNRTQAYNPSLTTKFTYDYPYTTIGDVILAFKDYHRQLSGHDKQGPVLK